VNEEPEKAQGEGGNGSFLRGCGIAALITLLVLGFIVGSCFM
jgi:hypothetical protein